MVARVKPLPHSLFLAHWKSKVGMTFARGGLYAAFCLREEMCPKGLTVDIDGSIC